eukprot:CAMPEP_0169113990 /NCGR_PEP_ID=MMETSP1015-20121227/28504_1 /TAXON_ID=342587 /ORGANISM="Karlodinium micrum, Strain CCMP2283" /LENGTH=184 /DNA_ID=CAMNT_0009176213 /DNA_START=84 /DNA_END=639 /DNA_ORIENTATION=-
MPTGKMLRWNSDKGFGFIQPDDGSEDLFCHVSGLLDGDDSVLEGDMVRFRISFDERKGKDRAVEVEAIGGGGGGRGGGAALVPAAEVAAGAAEVAIVMKEMTAGMTGVVVIVVIAVGTTETEAAAMTEATEMTVVEEAIMAGEIETVVTTGTTAVEEAAVRKVVAKVKGAKKFVQAIGNAASVA